MKPYLNKLNEGGNISVTNSLTNKTYSAEEVDLRKVNLNDFRNEIKRFLKTLNSLFKKEYNKTLWKDNDIETSFIYNGSSSFILHPDYEESEILKYKPKMGDIDITIPEEYLKSLFLLLEKYKNKPINCLTYKGNYRNNPDSLGVQLNTIFRMWFDDDFNPVDKNGKKFINIQIDFEGVSFVNGSPDEFAKFGHSSSFEDAKENIKAMHHKILISSIFTVISELPDSYVVTKTSTPDNLKQVSWNKTKVGKLIRFSGEGGIYQCLEPFLDDKGNQIIYNNLKVYKEISSKEGKYEKDLTKIFEYAFGGKGNIKDFHSFVGLCKLIKKYCDKETQNKILEVYLNGILSGKAPPKHKDINIDIELKLSAINYYTKTTNTKVRNLKQRIDLYIQKYGKK